jgi:hypothetical protein
MQAASIMLLRPQMLGEGNHFAVVDTGLSDAEEISLVIKF